MSNLPDGVARGIAKRMGWVRKKGGDRFQVVIELDRPPAWPINAVWNSRPILLALEAEPAGAGGDADRPIKTADRSK